MESPKKILISGAGLVGSLLAIALKRRGHQVHLFEQRFDMRKDSSLAGKSINLIITAKGIAPLVYLNLWEKVKEVTTPVMGRVMHSKDSKLTYQPYGKDETECNYSVSRGELNKLLMTEAEKEGVLIYFDSGLSSIDTGRKVAQFKNHKKDQSYDLFFGTDGAGSVTREAMINILKEKSSFKIEPLGADYKELSMPANKEGKHVLEKKALHIWPRGHHMLMALPNADGSFTMTLYMPVDWYEKFKTPMDIAAYFEENYPDAISLMPDYQKEYFENPQGFLGVVRMSPWIYQDQIALLGDAAHAIVPFFGQGMNCGFSDVQYLLNEFDKNSDDIQESFNQYNQHQKLNGDAIADLSVENFNIMCEKVGDEKFLFRKKVEHLIETSLPKIYRSRYGMITYTLIPYHMAKEAGHIQDEILTQLCENLQSPEDVSLELAKELISKKLTPWLDQNHLSLERYIP